MLHSHNPQPATAVSPVSSRSDSPLSRLEAEQIVVQAKDQSAQSSSASDYGQHQDLNIRCEGWLNKCNAPSALPSFSGSNYASSSSQSSVTSNNWRLVRAVLKDGAITLSKPPHDLAIKSFDTSVPSIPSGSTYNYPTQHPPYSTNGHISSSNHKRITSTSASTAKHHTLGLHNTHSNNSSIATANTSSSANTAPVHLHYRRVGLHPDLEFERTRIVGGTDEAICHTIMFGSSASFAKTAVLLLPLLTDIVASLDILTAYTNSAAHILSDKYKDEYPSYVAQTQRPPLPTSPPPPPPTSSSPHSGPSLNNSPATNSHPANPSVANNSDATSNNNNNATTPSVPNGKNTSDSSNILSSINTNTTTLPSSSPSSTTRSTSQQDTYPHDLYDGRINAFVVRLKLVVETMQDNFPGMLLDTTIFAALLKLVDSLSLHDYDISSELKKSVFMKQKSMTEILSYSHLEPVAWKSQHPTISDASSDKLQAILISIDSQNKNHFTLPGSVPLPPLNPQVEIPPSLPNNGGKYGSPNFLLQIPPDVILDLSIDVFAKQIYHFHLTFSKGWSPTSDISLLFNTNYSYNKHSPLVFGSTNIHFLGSLLIDHLFNVGQRTELHKIENSYRGRILTYWINLGNSLKSCGDMVGWLSIATVICSVPVLRLRSVWCYVMPEIRDRVTKEWAPVVFDLERRLMISDMSRKSTFHVLAPQGIGNTYPKERVVPFFGDLCVKYQEGSTYKQCESRLNRIRTAFERWESYLEHLPQNDTFEPMPDAIPVIQKLLYTLLTHHYEAPVVPPESVLKMSLSVEPNYLGQYLKYHYSQKSSLATGSFSPLLFTCTLPAFRLIPKTLLLNVVASQQPVNTKRTLRSSSSRSGDTFKAQSGRTQNSNMITNASQPQSTTPLIYLSTGYSEIDTPLRSFMQTVKVGSPLLQDVFDVLNVGTRVFHLGTDIILKNFDEETKRNIASHEPFLVDSSKGVNSSFVARHASNQIASHDPTALGLPYGSPEASPRHAGTNVNAVVKAANLERLVDILILGVSDFSIFLYEEDMARHPEIRPKRNGNNTNNDNNNNTKGANNTGALESSNSSVITGSSSVTAVAAGSAVHAQSSYPIFRVDMDVHTMTFFATYRSFCSATLLLESFRKRFVGAQSAALSIAKHLKNAGGSHEEHSAAKSATAASAFQALSANNVAAVGTNSDSTHFPNWDPTCDANPESIDWRIVAQIQIGVLEACHLWVSQYFSDFSNDLAARDQFLDLLRNFEVELQTWKDAGVLLRDDYKYYYDTIEALHRKVRKLFIKKSYRPIDIKKLLPTFPVGQHLEWLPMNGDIPTLERFIDDVDTVAAEYFNNVSMRDWMEVFEILEAQGSEISGFFNYKSPSANDDDPVALDIYTYLETFKNSHDEQRILSTFPRPVRELFRLRNNLISFFVIQVCDSRFKRDERVGFMMSILKLLGILRKRMSNMDVFFSETNPAFLNEDVKPPTPEGGDSRTATYGFPMSPHIPSFIESAISAALSRPECRYFANSWIHSAKELTKTYTSAFAGDAFSIETIVPEIPEDVLNRGRNGSPNLVTPCVGWLFERLFEIVLYLPNMSPENSKLINFDKHRYTYNIISSILDVRLCLQSMDTRFQISLGESPAATSFMSRIAYIVNPKKELFRLERRLAQQTATKELKEHYPRSAAKARVFPFYAVAEVEKIKRDSRQRELLERQAKELKKASSKNKVSAEGGAFSDRKTSKSRFGGFFKAVRPISMAFSGSFTPPSEKVVHPDNLPSLSQMTDSKFKHIRSIKLIDSEIAHMRLGKDTTLFKILTKGEEFWFQAPSDYKTEEWVRSLEMSRKYANLMALMSPTSAKVFGVPIGIVCEREHAPMPKVVEMLLSEVEERGLQEVGIYRIPGSLASVNALKAAFDSGEEVNMKDDRWYDVNTVTGCFKLYLRELPEPLLTTDLLGDFVACGPIANTNEGIVQLRRCVQQLPKPNYNLLKRLVEHLNKVMINGEFNKMHAVNLAIVFSMSLLPSSSSTALMNTELGSMQTILKTMITTYERIFVNEDGDVNDDDTVQSHMPESLSEHDQHLAHGQHQPTSILRKGSLSTTNETIPEQQSIHQYRKSSVASSFSLSNSQQKVMDDQTSLASSALPSSTFSPDSAGRATPPAHRPSVSSTLSHRTTDDAVAGSSLNSPLFHVDGDFDESRDTFGDAESGLEGRRRGSESGIQNNNNNDGADNTTMESLSTAMANNSLLVAPTSRSNTRLTAEGRNKRFSSLILPSEFTPPIVPDDSSAEDEGRRRALDLEEGIPGVYGGTRNTKQNQKFPDFDSFNSGFGDSPTSGPNPTAATATSGEHSEVEGRPTSPAGSSPTTTIPGSSSSSRFLHSAGTNGSANTSLSSTPTDAVNNSNGLNGVSSRNNDDSSSSSTNYSGGTNLHARNTSEMSIIREINSEEEDLEEESTNKQNQVTAY